ncbi:MAG: hypothetical protein GF364_20275 [Candidatus Lokiarchaeota archaeon]|nr:hypothetical protein [Candidatus Lokiarchaeota archaeon]
MSKTLKFCPNCGAELKGAKFCPECGYDTSEEVFSAQDDAKETQAKSKEQKGEASGKFEPFSGKPNPVWDFIGPYMPEIGKWGWLALIILNAIVFLVDIIAYAIANAIIPVGGFPVYSLIALIVNVVLSLLWIKPKFAEPLVEQKYAKVLEDVIEIKNFRIPIILLVGIIVEIFGYGWTGLVVLAPVLIILLFGPVPYYWTTNVNKPVENSEI